MEKQFKINKLEELQQVVNYLVELSKSQKHFCFSGEMGAGKTTLINLICREMGVTEHTSSPTYSIVNEYVGKERTIHHFDLFRIKDAFELLDIGIEEIIDSNTICFIEWPDKIMRFLPNNHAKIEIKQKAKERIFTISIQN